MKTPRYFNKSIVTSILFLFASTVMAQATKQAQAPAKGAPVVASPEHQSKILGDIGKMNSSLKSLIQSEAELVKYYESARRLGSLLVIKSVCHDKVKSDLKNESTNGAKKTDAKTAKAEYDNRWFDCLEEEMNGTYHRLDLRAGEIKKVRDDIRGVEQAIASQVKQYNSFQGVKPIAAPSPAAFAELKAPDYPAEHFKNGKKKAAPASGAAKK